MICTGERQQRSGQKNTVPKRGDKILVEFSTERGAYYNFLNLMRRKKRPTAKFAVGRFNAVHVYRVDFLRELTSEVVAVLHANPTTPFPSNATGIEIFSFRFTKHGKCTGPNKAPVSQVIAVHCNFPIPIHWPNCKAGINTRLSFDLIKRVFPKKRETGICLLYTSPSPRD